MQSLHRLLAAISLLCVLANGEKIQPFRVGVAVGQEGDLKTDVCTEEEMEFIKGILKKYVVGLAQLFFHDQSIELSGELAEIDGTQFADAAFEDFNSYEVTKFAGATGEVVDTTGTLSPSASLAPSDSPTKSPVEVFLHIEDDPLPVANGVEVFDNVAHAPVSSPVAEKLSLRTAGSSLRLAPISSAPIELVETDAPVVPPATSMPVTSAPSTAPVTAAPVTPVAGDTLAPISSAPIERVETDAPVASPTTPSPVTAAPVTTAPVIETDAPVATPVPTSFPTSIPSVTPTPAPTNEPSLTPSLTPVCEDDCVIFDFSKYPNGTNVGRGDYISTEWRDTLGLRIHTKPFGDKAYAPNYAGSSLRMPRIFDTNNPAVDKNNGDYDLGSPNENCGGGGTGIGSAGKPGQPGENCEPLGNVLIIQEGDKDTPDDDADGGVFIFLFDNPVELKSIGLLDMDPKKSCKITTRTFAGDAEIIDVVGLGDNGAQEVHFSRSDVRKIIVEIGGSGAITSMNFCLPGCANEVTSRARHLEIDDQTKVLSSSRNTDNQGKSNGDTKAIVNPDDVTNRRLVRFFRFVYGGEAAMICRYCDSDGVDGRRLMTNSGFLISALETVLSFGLTADMSWSYKEFLEKRNQTVGCMGDGNLVRVAFELTAPL